MYLGSTQVDDNYSSRKYIGGMGKRLEGDVKAVNLAKKNYAQL